MCHPTDHIETQNPRSMTEIVTQNILKLKNIEINTPLKGSSKLEFSRQFLKTGPKMRLFLKNDSQNLGSEDADSETRTRNPSIINRVL